MDESNPFADRRVRSLIGLSSGLVVASVAIVFLEGTVRWMVLGMAVLDVIVTPYILKLAMQAESDGEEVQA